MSGRVFASRQIVGLRAFGWQVDYRPDGWLPFSVRHGRNDDWATVVSLGRLGCVTFGRLATPPDPRNAGWHYTDLPYICGAPTPSGPCYAESPSPDGSCVRHAEVAP